MASPGYLQKSGASYACEGTSQQGVSDVDGSVLDVGTMKENRLTPDSLALVQASAFSPRPLPLAVASELRVASSLLILFCRVLILIWCLFLIFLTLHPGIGIC